MLLAIDVGDTNLVCGLYEGRELKQFWRLETNQGKSADEYGIALKQMFVTDGYGFDSVDSIVISNVVPSMTFMLQHLCEKYFNKEPLILEPGVKTGLIVKYDNPKSLGSDRIANAVAAYANYPAPLMVIDFDTATTFCAVTDKAEYIGGAIAPGIKISSEALFKSTSKLPRIELEVPKHVICRNAAECMQSGVLYGHIGMVEYLVKRMKEEIAEECGFEPGSKKITVIATGGLASSVVPLCRREIILDDGLLLKGLMIIYRRNN